MAKVGGRQLTLGACGLTKFAETADGRQVQLHIPKYVQGPVGRPCRYADRGCPFRSQRGTALSSHERRCKKQPPPVVAEWDESEPEDESEEEKEKGEEGNDDDDDWDL